MGSWVVVMGLLVSPVALGAEAEVRTLRFTKKAPVVGSREENQTRMEMAFDFKATAPSIEPIPIVASTTVIETQVFTVLAVKGNAVTRAQVAYGEMDEVKMEDGKEVRSPAPVSKKTYVGEFKKGSVVVTNAQGKPVPDAEQAKVREDLKGLGREDPLVAAFPTEPLKVGDSVQAVADAFEEELQATAPEGMSYNDTRVELTEVRDDARGPMGVFAVSTTIVAVESEESPVSMEIRAKGSLHVLADGTVVTEISMGGPVKLIPQEVLRQRGMEVQGKGEMRVHLTSKVLPRASKK
ncbi:hypothetical protein NVS55_04460 [Myxococcus stipitatus]|uniref:hypothetical protein n=1 Tax=Myxococcus stipitatus TaxID=83455 RepID=UPI00314534B5